MAGSVAGNVANQAISKGVKNISAKEAAAAGAAEIMGMAGSAAKKAGSKAVSKIAGAAAGEAGMVAAKKAGAKAAQKTLASSAAAGVVGAGADAIPEGKIASAVGKENVYDLMKRKGIPSTLSDEEIAAARAVDLRMQAGKKSASGTVGKSGIQTNNPFYKPGGGSDLDDFMTPHAEKHAFNSKVQSTKKKLNLEKI